LALLDLLIADSQLKPGDPVADFGAGTGIFSRMLVERGLKVTAIEPNAQMRNERDVPEARWLDGTFEASGLAEESQCWATAAQAFHWADPKRSLPEIRRVLVPGCVFTVLWNNRLNQESELLGWTETAIRKHVPEFEEAYRHRDWAEVLEFTGDFAFLKHRAMKHTVPMSKSRYLDLWRSHNRLNTMAGVERMAALLAEIEGYLVQQGLDELEVPYRCESWSARRTG
jgi:ubiquinone/menaquinone biosynthesis C-methylase UbiE